MSYFSVKTRLYTFAKSEDGAVTVDWVVLAAALTSLGILVALTVSDGIENLSTDLSNSLSDRDIAVEFTRANGGIGGAQLVAQSFQGGGLTFNGATSALNDNELDALSGWVNDVRIGVDAASPSEQNDYARLDLAVNEAYADRGRTRPTNGGYDPADLASAANTLDLQAAQAAAVSG